MEESSNLADNDPQVLTLERALEILTSGVVSVDHGLLPWGSNYAYLISVTEAEPLNVKPAHEIVRPDLFPTRRLQQFREM